MSTNLNNNADKLHQRVANNNTTNQQATKQDHTQQQIFFSKTKYPYTENPTLKRKRDPLFVGEGQQHIFALSNLYYVVIILF